MFLEFEKKFPFSICFERLEKALALFVGTYDFRFFSKEVAEKDTVRTIQAIVLSKSACDDGFVKPNVKFDNSSSNPSRNKCMIAILFNSCTILF